MGIFKARNFLEVFDRFKTDLDCKEYLSGLKKQLTYHCVKCNHNACQIKIDFERQCNMSGHKESATANVFFIRLNLVLRRLFSFASKCLRVLKAYQQVIGVFVTE